MHETCHVRGKMSNTASVYARENPKNEIRGKKRETYNHRSH